MNAALRTLAAAALSAAAALAGARPADPAPAPLKALHPDIALLDAAGTNVLASGGPLSTTKTCGQCHDTAYIASHSFHADLGLRAYKPAATTWDASPGLFGRWDPLRYRFLSQAGDERLDLSTPQWLMLNAARLVGGGPATTSRAGQPLTALKPDAGDPETSLTLADGTRGAWDWAASGTLEVDCFLCHLDQPNLGARTAAIRAGRFADASTATLQGLGVVEPAAKGWAWNRAAFTAEGKLDSRKLAVQDPTNANCAACHGEVHPAGSQPLQVDACNLDQPMTATTGEVVASQRINASALNLAGKRALDRSWDVHAERQLQCTDCHHALNNPAHGGAAKGSHPAHLRYDPRALDLKDYLQRPDHDFARGQGAQLPAAADLKGTMRRCENCHDAAQSHARWLPYVETHMATLACESCHVPHQHAPAIQSYDWTVLQADGRPVRACRGVEGPPGDVRSLVTGFDPVLLKRNQGDQAGVLAPYNLVTTFYWVYEDAGGRKRPVRLADLQAAFLEGGRHAPAIVSAFDADGDGVVGAAELRIDAPRKEAAVKARLEALGLRQVRMEGQVQPFNIKHGVARGAQAVNQCQSCHAAGSRLTQPMQLAGFAPVLPVLATDRHVAASGNLARRDDGQLFYEPAPARDAIYVFGASRIGWVDLIGALAVAGTLAGVAVHGGLRYLAWRRRPAGHAATRRVHMYDAYRRLWHWLQAICIVALLATGLVIHRPDLFSALPFSAMVTLHNVLAAILTVNAALSLFYHLATERMREYLPRPYGFFDDAIRQARYYQSGIFKGEPHPFDKRPDNRMNPLQKATYFGVLNVLLPLQIVTGALMWGVQHWPAAATALGGLPLLAPFHTLLAWLFASFILGHLYLATMGSTPLEAVRAMVTGYEEVEVHETAAGRR